MVQQHPTTGLDDFLVDRAKLYAQDQLIFEAPSPIAALARMGDRLYVILDCDPKIHDEAFIGENLWCLDLSGRLVWKAENLNSMYPDWSGRPRNNAYTSVRVIGAEHVRLHPGTMEDRQVILLDPASGRALPHDPTPWRPDDPENQVLAASRLFRCVMAS